MEFPRVFITKEIASKLRRKCKKKSCGISSSLGFRP